MSGFTQEIDDDIRATAHGDVPGPMDAVTPLDLTIVPGGTFLLRVEHTVREGRCPLFDHGPRMVTMPPYWLGRTPVTNDQFAAFLDATAYRPVEPRNFLRHWVDGFPPPGKGAHPVVWVSPRDAEAYAVWAGLRLPTDEEWQWAAQGPEGLAWPWGNTFEETRCNGSAGGTTAVAQFPGGCSPYGCLDMTGNTWEWTGPEWDDGWHRWRLLRGGSYYAAQGSFWYAPGGPCSNTAHLRFLLLSEGLNRCATVGFRCAADLRNGVDAQ